MNKNSRTHTCNSGMFKKHTEKIPRIFGIGLTITSFFPSLLIFVRKTDGNETPF